ncbi:hypothetical protein CL633_04405 [bacterium]|jgi:hypothetical protein|nr:hypothetical protein [bacterium]|tara:strand:- start:1981 stop:2904 length:924 start_codon:yes stop_codon:yes gene_type:complete
MKNYGLRVQYPQPQDYILGGESKVENKVLQDSGQWDKYLPTAEFQSGVYFDSMACVTYSALNCLEILQHRILGFESNWSDRYTAKMSGTTKKGNYLIKVGESIRKDGIVEEKLYPYPRLQRNPVFDWEDYYKEIPKKIIDKGHEFIEENLVQHEWVETTMGGLIEGLKYAPLQVTVHAWQKPVNGIYQKTTKGLNHAVTLYGYELGRMWKIYDHYAQTNKFLAWDFNFGLWAFKYSFARKENMFKQEFKKKHDAKLVFNNETGEWGYFYDNSLIVPQTNKEKANILAQYLIRREGVNVDQDAWLKLL